MAVQLKVELSVIEAGHEIVNRERVVGDVVEAEVVVVFEMVELVCVEFVVVWVVVEDVVSAVVVELVPLDEVAEVIVELVWRGWMPPICWGDLPPRA